MKKILVIPFTFLIALCVVASANKNVMNETGMNYIHSGTTNHKLHLHLDEYQSGQVVMAMNNMKIVRPSINSKRRVMTGLTGPYIIINTSVIPSKEENFPAFYLTLPLTDVTMDDYAGNSFGLIENSCPEIQTADKNEVVYLF